MNETREALRDYLAQQRWDAFFTATFAPLKLPERERNDSYMRSPGCKFSHMAIDKVVKVLTMPRLKPTKLFVAAEQHMLGGWHCHGLMEYPRRSNGELFHGEDMTKFQRNSLAPLGFNVVSGVNDVSACSLYLSKYLVKDEWHGDWRMTGRKKFWQGV